uniref:NADH dehydrogenase subunit 6 n=1 Tax=Bhatia longiradiata TaxID=3108584 RepID=UPI002E79B96A|nr:NADH dehydrogenase subunit 6 [Bhatia longiradiata]WQH58297.1 NADH dehydrogenase subunit 6 [Bhatia longiradiata]
MKMFLMKSMLVISTTIFLMNTPMTMGVMLLVQTFISTIFMAKMMSSSWLMMILFMMMVGGLLILFMYMSSIASNEKFKSNFMMIVLLIILMIPIEELIFDVQMKDGLKCITSVESLTLLKIYNKKVLFITLFLFCYLLLTMVVVTKIIKIYKGPLRSK